MQRDFRYLRDQYGDAGARDIFESICTQLLQARYGEEEEKLAQSQYLNKLHLLYNQYTSEIEKKELAIEGYITFNKFEFQFCPNCLKPVKKADNLNVCCLCGSEKVR